MTIFGNSRLGPLPYVALLLAMFAFDFAKGPIERFIMALHDQAARELMAPRPAPPAQPAKSAMTPAPRLRNEHFKDQNMPLMLNSQQAAVNQILASGRRPTVEELDKMTAETALEGVSMLLGGGPDPQTARLVSKRFTFQTLHMVAVVVMTAMTVIGLLYAISGRLRDIGWPQAVLWLMLAPVFLPKLLAVPLSTHVVYGITVFFYGLILVLALLPSQGAGPTEPVQASAEPRPDAVARRRPGRFGKLGS